MWANDNLTTFEPSKTAMMVVGEKRPPFDPTGVEMGGYVVSQVDSVKVTGFTFDSKLLWSNHIDLMVKKAKQRVGVLRNLVPYLDSTNMKLMYDAFVRSILEYGNYMGMFCIWVLHKLQLQLQVR